MNSISYCGYIHNIDLKKNQLWLFAGGGLVMVDYSPLWDTMRKRGITQYMILQDKVLDNHTLDVWKEHEHHVDYIGRICTYPGLHTEWRDSVLQNRTVVYLIGNYK